MKLIDADDLYQKCIEIQLKKRNRYFDIDDVIKLIKKAPTVDVLDKIRAEIEFIPTIEWKDNGTTYILASYFKKQVLEIIDKYIK